MEEAAVVVLVKDTTRVVASSGVSMFRCISENNTCT